MWKKSGASFCECPPRIGPTIVLIISQESTIILQLCVAAELVWTRCPCPKILGHGIADRGNACFHEVSVSQNFRTLICGLPNSCGSRNLSPGLTTETRISVSQDFGPRICGPPESLLLRGFRGPEVRDTGSLTVAPFGKDYQGVSIIKMRRRPGSCRNDRTGSTAECEWI